MPDAKLIGPKVNLGGDEAEIDTPDENWGKSDDLRVEAKERVRKGGIDRERPVGIRTQIR